MYDYASMGIRIQRINHIIEFVMDDGTENL
jgi:hypothetical protein